MSLKLGSTSIGSLYLGSTKIGAAYLGNVKVYESSQIDPYNPLGLPALTIRCKFASGYTPDMGDTQTLVNSAENIWDIYKSATDWRSLFSSNQNILSVLGANTSDCTYMAYMFNYCENLSSVALFDTSACTWMLSMFNTCSSLTSIPLFPTNRCKNVKNMFWLCRSVTSGALALYQQMSTQATPPSTHSGCFYGCGSNTTSGAAELAQIPSSWGGTGA